MEISAGIGQRSQALPSCADIVAKSPKLPGLICRRKTIRPHDRRFDIASITLARSRVSFSSGDEVPHIFTRKSCVQPKEILITSAKRLLQQNRPQPD